MSLQPEKRIFTRFRIPVVVDAPALSDFPLVPEDVSASGFKVVVAEPPEMGQSFDCSIQIAEEMLESCRGEVVWVQKSQGEVSGWQIGIAVGTKEVDRKRLAALLESLSSEFGAIRSIVPEP